MPSPSHSHKKKFAANIRPSHADLSVQLVFSPTSFRSGSSSDSSLEDDQKLLMNPASRLLLGRSNSPAIGRLARTVLNPNSSASSNSTNPSPSASSTQCRAAREYATYRPNTQTARRPKTSRPENADPKKTRKGTTVSESIVPKLALHELRSVYSQEIFVFRCDLETLQIDGAMKTYETLRNVDILTHDDISNLARQLHTHYRLHRDRNSTYRHLLMLINDLQKNVIPGHPLASVHILTALKDMGEYDTANKFWEWLEEQQEEFTDARVYGAAIELFSAQEKPLEETEQLYTAALMRYTEGVSAQTAKQTNLTTKSMLLQGICTARIMAGAWESAYEAFDTAARMYPDRVPSRIYELFIYQRPLEEAVLVFFMACRNGTPPLPKVFQALLSQVNKDSGDLITLFRMVYTYAAAGGKLRHESLTTLLQGVLAAYPTLKENDPETKLDDLLEIVNTLFQEYAAIGINPHTHHFNAIISMAGRLKNEELILMALKDFLTTGLAPTPTTFRSMLAAFEKVRNADQVVETWKTYCASRTEGFLAADSTRTSLSLASPALIARDCPWAITDFKILIRASVLTSNIPFVTSELARLRPSLPPTLYDEASSYLTWASSLGPEKLAASIASSEAKHSRTGSISAPSSLSALHDALRALSSTFRSTSFGDFARDPNLAFIDGEGAPPPDISARPGTPMWTVYEKLCGAFKKDLKNEESKRRITTGLTLRQARFANWRTINRLLALAKEKDSTRGKSPAGGYVILRDRPHWTVGLRRLAPVVEVQKIETVRVWGTVSKIEGGRDWETKEMVIEPEPERSEASEAGEDGEAGEAAKVEKKEKKEVVEKVEIDQARELTQERYEVLDEVVRQAYEVKNERRDNRATWKGEEVRLRTRIGALG